MSIHEEYEYGTVGVDAGEYDRYREVDLGDGTVIVYDKHDEDRWIQSDEAVDVEDMA